MCKKGKAKKWENEQNGKWEHEQKKKIGENESKTAENQKQQQQTKTTSNKKKYISSKNTSSFFKFPKTLTIWSIWDFKSVTLSFKSSTSSPVPKKVDKEFHEKKKSIYVRLTSEIDEL